MKLIDKDALIAEIESKKIYAQTLGDNAINSSMQQFYDGMREGCNSLLNFLNTLEVKEVEENKLSNPRFPHLDNIVDKVFGTGNLESWEYEEAEQLVLLAKEELLKDLEVKEVDLNECARHYLLHEHISPLNEVLHQVDLRVEIQYHKDIEDAYKAGFELGLKAKWQKEQDEPTASDRGMADEIIIHLKRIGEDYKLSLTKEIQWLRNITKKGE